MMEAWQIADYKTCTEGPWLTRFLVWEKFASAELCIKLETFLEQREVAFLSPSKICENLNFKGAQ